MDVDRKTLQYWNDRSLLTDKQKVKGWLGEQSTSIIFELFEKVIAERIDLYEKYSLVVRNNAGYSLSTSNEALLARLKALANESLAPKDERYVDGVRIIEKVNNLED